MERLPVELLERVCCFLCFHCRTPGCFPNADIADVVADKASLARLCRVSKSVCAVAQPFVFHYYATGNLPWYYRDDPTHPGYLYSLLLESWPRTNDLLPFFLRSIILRPDLAKCVRALQLVTPQYVKKALIWHKGPEDDISPAIRKASTDLGLVAFNVFHPEYMHWVRNKPDPEDHITIGYVHHTLEQLAILLCPRVSTLLLMGDFSPYTGNLLRSSGRTFLALKTIGLISHDNSGHYAHTGPGLLSLAPNLQTLYAIDARNKDLTMPPSPDRISGVAPFEGSPGASLFAVLQKAALHDLGLRALFAFVRAAPALCELCYTETWGGHYERPEDYFWDLARGLEPARHTLRRLVLRVPAAPGSPSPGAAVVGGLERLEELSISQAAVYGFGGGGDSVPPLAGGLVGFLPASLVELCISQVDQDFEADLRELARDAPRCLPRLRSVTVGCGDNGLAIPESVDGEVLVFFGEKVRAELRDVFEKVGIVLRWGPWIEDEGEDVPGLPVCKPHSDGNSWELTIW